ncbi:MAG: hypothetical protein Kow0069_14180 [Promethearchaeota archaeon]
MDNPEWPEPVGGSGANLLASITHAEDLDGLASQALLLRWADRVGRYSEVALWRENYLMFPGSFREAARLSADKAATGRVVDLVVTDLGFNPDVGQAVLEAAELLKGVAGVRLVYYDHHASTRAKEAWLRRRGFWCRLGADDQCATRLVADHLLPRDAHARELADVASEADERLEGGARPDVRALNRTIGLLAGRGDERARRLLGKIVDAMREPGYLELDWLATLVSESTALYEEEVARLPGRVTWREVGVEGDRPVSVACTWSDVLSPADQAEELIALTRGTGRRVDLALGVAPDGRVVVFTPAAEGGAAMARGSEENEDGSGGSGGAPKAGEIASALGGGGHERRAGYQSRAGDGRPAPQVAAAVLDEVTRTIEELELKLKKR